MLHATLEEARIKPILTGPFFLTEPGTLYCSFRTALERAVQKGQIPDVTYHDPRSTRARHLVMAGVDLPTVKELLGHKNISIALRYAHLSSDHKQNAVIKLVELGKKSHHLLQQSRQDEVGKPYKSLET